MISPPPTPTLPSPPVVVFGRVGPKVVRPRELALPFSGWESPVLYLENTVELALTVKALVRQPQGYENRRADPAFYLWWHLSSLAGAVLESSL